MNPLLACSSLRRFKPVPNSPRAPTDSENARISTEASASVLAKNDYYAFDECARGLVDRMGESRLRGGRGGNSVGDFPFFQFLGENVFDLLANAVHALIGEQSPRRYRQGDERLVP